MNDIMSIFDVSERRVSIRDAVTVSVTYGYHGNDCWALDYDGRLYFEWDFEPTTRWGKEYAELRKLGIPWVKFFDSRSAIGVLVGGDNTAEVFDLEWQEV